MLMAFVKFSVFKNCDRIARYCRVSSGSTTTAGLNSRGVCSQARSDVSNRQPLGKSTFQTFPYGNEAAEESAPTDW